jgi:hypothetical protein
MLIREPRPPKRPRKKPTITRPPLSAEAQRELDEARRVDGEIRALARKCRATEAAIAVRLAHMKRRGLHRRLGFAAINVYARRTLGFGASKTRGFVEIGERIDRLPKMREAFFAGELDWTKVRTAVSVATPETDEVWLERARTLDSRQLECLATGKEPPIRRMLVATGEEWATIEDALIALEKETGRRPKLGEALASICRRALAGGGADGRPLGGPKTRVVIHLCGECEKATRETREAPVEVSAASVEMALCDAEVLDIRNGAATIRRTMPPRIANLIDARDRGRCLAPGCDERASVQRHHEGGWRAVGHDPKKIGSLCEAHHRDRHEGRILIEGDAPHFRFYLADGTPLGPNGPEPESAPVSAAHEAEDAPVSVSADPGDAHGRTTPRPSLDAPGAHVSTATPTLLDAPGAHVSTAADPGDAHVRATAAPTRPAPAHVSTRREDLASPAEHADGPARHDASGSQTETDVTGDVYTALRRLELRPREARAVLDAALAGWGSQPMTAEGLLRAALSKRLTAG